MPLATRKKLLQQMLKMLQEHRDAIYDAVHKDLRKSKHETQLAEFALIETEIAECLNHLDEWTAPKLPAQGVDLLYRLDGATARFEPLGVVLVIGAW